MIIVVVLTVVATIGLDLVAVALTGIGIGALAYVVYKVCFSGSEEPATKACSKTEGPRTVDVIRWEDKCSAAIQRIEKDTLEYPVVGLYCEWQNNWNGTNEKVAIISLCTANGYCAILLLRKWNFLPSTLKTFMNNENIIKVGVGIDRDQYKLQADYGLLLSGIVDLRFVAKKYGCPTRSLQYLAEEIAHISINDTGRSNWNDDPSSTDDLEYAAMDVYASIEIMKKLVPRKGDVMKECYPFINRKFTTTMNNF